MTSHYQTLGLTPAATAAEIKTAFRKLAMVHHPDKNPGNAASESLFKEITNAYETLGDEDKRATYDMNTGHPYGSSSGGHHDTWARSSNQNGPNYDDILNDIMRSRANGQSSRTFFYEGIKNRDITLVYSITLEEAFLGKETSVKYRVGGESKSLNLKVPRGIQHGVKLRYEKQGDHADASVPPGDLFVTIAILPHPCFEREGSRLLVGVEIDYFDAILGTEVKVPTIDGSEIRIKVPAGTTPNQTMRVAGRGMADNSGRGDMFVEVHLVPLILNLDQHRLIREIKAKPALDS
jgi:curved DNA-binding protein